MELDILNIKGEKTGRVAQLDDAIFNITPNQHVVWLDVKRIRNANRQGTHKAKERAEMKGSTRKLVKQKGSGGARRGDINSPLLRGGARVFGPRVRDYDIKLNKKVKALARRSALSVKAQASSIIVVENFTMDAPKTRDFQSILSNLAIDNATRTLLLTSNIDANLFLSARNLPNATVAPASDLNTYSLLHAKKVIVTEDALSSIHNLFNA